MTPDAKSTPAAKWCSSPLRFVVLVALSMCAAQFLAMLLLFLLPSVSAGIRALLETALHTAAVIPVLYIFLFRPMRLHLHARHQVEVALREARDETEALVRQRTGEPARVNQALREDIAARQRLEDAMRRSVFLYRNLVESMSEGLVQVDNADVIQFVNGRFCAMTGYSRKELLATTATEVLVNPEDRAIVREKSNLRLQGLKDCYELELKKKSGELIWVQVCGAPVLDANGTVTGSIGILTDITGRKRAEQQLRESEAQYRLLFEGNPHPMWILDVETLGFLAVNAAAVEHYGYSSEEFRQMTLADISPAEDVPAMQANVARVKSDLDHVGVWRHRKKDGTLIFVEITVQAMTFNARRAELVLAGDVTERKRAEEALQRNEEYFRSLIENTSDTITVLDANGTIRYESPSIQRVLGYAPEALVGQSLFGFLHPNDIPTVAQALETKRGGPASVATFEARFRHTDGSWRTFEGIGKNLLHDPAVAGVVINSRDVTERRQAHEALEREHKRLLLLNDIVRAIADHQDLPSLFRVVLTHLEDHLPIELGSAMLFDPQGTTLTLVARGPASRALAAQNGWPKENDVLSPVDTGLAACLEGEMVYLRDTQQTDLSVPRLYGQAGLRSILGVPLRVENRTIGILVMVRRGVDAFSDAERDFLRQLSEHVALAAAHTELLKNLKRAYEDLRQSQQTAMQQERLRALGQMASGIAHDINNALMPIVGFSDMLLQDESALDAEQKHCLQAIKTSGSDIASTVARMREFYRKRGDTEELRLVDLNQLVRQTIDLTRPRWRDIPQERGRVIKVRTELAAGLALMLGNESELRETLTNLIINATDAMPDGGTIAVRTRQDQGELLLEVSDTGGGMDGETRKRCLEPFYTTKGDRGTGLGLAMVYGAVQRHEGRIEIESALREGTTMRLIFPLRETGPAGQVSPEGVPSPRGLRLLVIDDDPLVRDGVLKLMLQKDDHEVSVADGGESGIAAFREACHHHAPFDVVLTDLGMPYVDGREVARSVKAESPQTPVILVTGWGGQLQAEGDIPAGVDAVLGKPIRMKDLRRVLAKVLNAPAAQPPPDHPEPAQKAVSQ